MAVGGPANPAAPGPWSWVPPEWDTSGGVPDQPILPPDWMAGPGAPTEAAPLLPDPVAEPPPGMVLGFPRNPDEPPDADLIEIEPPDADLIEIEPDDREANQARAGAAGDAGMPAWARAMQPREELGTPTLPPPAAGEDDLLDPYASELADPYADKMFPGAPEGPTGELIDPYRRPYEDRGEALAADPVALARAKVEREDMIERTRANRAFAESERQRQLLEENEARRVQATEIAQRDLAEITAQAKAMADSSPFEQWWSSRSDVGKFSGVVAAIFGGFMMGKTGGRNPALDFFAKLAEDDANQKWMSIRERRGLAQDQLAQARDDFKQREAFRLASYEQVARGLEAELARLDPEGSAAIKLGEALAGVQQQQAQLVAAARKRSFDEANITIQRDQEQQRIEIEAAKAADQALQWRASLREQRAARYAAAAKEKEQDPRFTPAYFKAIGLKPPPEKPDGTGWSMKEYENWIGLADKSQTEPARLREEREEHAAQMERKVFNPVTGEEIGEVWNSKVRDRINTVLPDATMAIMTIDKLVRLADEFDGASSTIKGEEFQRLTSNAEMLNQMNRVAFEMGALDTGSVASMERMRGGVDVTSFVRDVAPGLLELRANLVDKTQLALRSANLDPKKWKPPEAYRPKAAARNPTVEKLSQEPPGGAISSAMRSARVIGGISDPRDVERDQGIATLVAEGNTAALAQLAAGAPDEDTRAAAARALVEVHLGFEGTDPERKPLPLHLLRGLR